MGVVSCYIYYVSLNSSYISLFTRVLFSMLFPNESVSLKYFAQPILLAYRIMIIMSKLFLYAINPTFLNRRHEFLYCCTFTDSVYFVVSHLVVIAEVTGDVI